MLSLALLSACSDYFENDVVDADGDGLPAGTDCDDKSAAVGVGDAYYPDQDRDTFGDAHAASEYLCLPQNGFSSNKSDCDDNSASTHPNADEACDGEDNDCDGFIDANDPDASDLSVWYEDVDGDGFGDPTTEVKTCGEQPQDYVDVAGDCDDLDPTIYPNAPELVDGEDNDCDGEVDEDPVPTTWYADVDGDGYGDPDAPVESVERPEDYVANDRDCDDADFLINPDADEVCDGLDNDCDGLTDDDDPDVVDIQAWYRDADGDGYGTEDDAMSACEQPEGYVSIGGDCDDSDPAFNPGASETDCEDPNDYNCDGVTGYADTDGDSFPACGDCDDTDPLINPDADELCLTTGVDDDCDGDVDEADAADVSTWYEDSDHDGFGNSSVSVTGCVCPTGYVADSTDFDDAHSEAYPGAIEVCDDIDNDGDSLTDGDDPSAVGLATWYLDADGDGYGDPGDSVEACSAPDSSYVSNSSDCDDTDPAINPDTVWYEDVDGDGFGDSSTAYTGCVPPSGDYILDGGDLDDSDPFVYPFAPEICDGVDNDGDSLIDDDDPDRVGGSTWYADADSDGYGDPTVSTVSCASTGSAVSDASDCDDTNASINPAATEICDSTDDDCDGLTDDDDPGVTGTTPWYVDADGDGYGSTSATYACVAPSGTVEDSTDCDDGDDEVNPGATEICLDGLDQDCDAVMDDQCQRSLSDADVVLGGEVASGLAGDSCAFAGDMDNDGWEDFLVGAVDAGSSGEGAAYLVFGPLSGSRVLSASVDMKIVGAGASFYLGRSVSSIGDMDSDGNNESIIGVYGDDTNGVEAGAVVFIEGSVGFGTVMSSSLITWFGEAAGDKAGFNVKGGGDSNGDGAPEVLVGAYGHRSRVGAAYLLTTITGGGELSDAGAVMNGVAAGDAAGGAVNFEDLDADGLDDVFVGAWGESSAASGAGAVYVLNGPIAGEIDLSTADAELQGETASQWVGSVVSSAGDLDSDGYNDLLTSGYGYNSNQGRVYVVRGPVSGTSSLAVADLILEGEAVGDMAGISLSQGGDVNGDGNLEILIGAREAYCGSLQTGAVYYFTGPLVSGLWNLSEVDGKFCGGSAGDKAGFAVAGGVDSDADGFDDVLVGSYYQDYSGLADSGAVQLIFGDSY